MPVIAEYNFEQSGQPGPADISGNNHALTWGQFSSSVPGYHGDFAIQSDPTNMQEILGSAAYGAYPGGTPATNPLSILFWAKAPVITPWSPLLSILNSAGREDPMGIWVEPDGSLSAEWYDASNVVSSSAISATSSVVAPDTWLHVAAVFVPGTGVTIYANGVAVSTYNWQGSGSNAFYNTWETLLVGGSRWGSYGAIIDDLRIYDEAVTGLQIAALMEIPVGGSGSTAVNRLRIGSDTPSRLYYGDIEMDRAYLGTTLVYGTGGDAPADEVPTLYIDPPTGSYELGDTVQIAIRADSQTTEVNVVQANITYPTNRLTFQSINRTGSPFTNAIQETGGSGQVSIGVGILGGSTSGDNLVATVTFTATGVGTAALDFVNTSGIADYATSTNICQAMVGASYDLS